MSLLTDLRFWATENKGVAEGIGWSLIIGGFILTFGAPILVAVAGFFWMNEVVDG